MVLTILNKKACAFTISSVGYINQSVVSLRSIKNNISNNKYQVDLIIFCIENICKNIKNKIKKQFDIEIVDLNSVKDETVKKCIDKYKKNRDILRWSNKPSLSSYLIERYDVVLYMDNDIYFVNNCDELIEQTHKGILLTPHNKINTNLGICHFKQLLKHGFFNAGFFGVNKFGKNVLKWWSEAILWDCSKNFKEGIFVDQKYLDILALEFNENVQISKNKGYNIADWNINCIDMENISPIFFHFSRFGKNQYSKNYQILKEAYLKFKEEAKVVERILNNDGV
jgi:hypothetical protein